MSRRGELELEELNLMSIQLVDEKKLVHEPASKSVVENSVKLVFSDLPLANITYELRFLSHPVAQQDVGRPVA